MSDADDLPDFARFDPDDDPAFADWMRDERGLTCLDCARCGEAMPKEYDRAVRAALGFGLGYCELYGWVTDEETVEELGNEWCYRGWR